MKAMRPAAAIASTLLLSLPAILLAGCGDFWENPNGSTSSGTTTDTVTLTQSATTIPAGGTDILTATVAPTTATGTVEFLSGGASIGTATLSSGSASYTATFSSAGTETLTANYEGNSTYESMTSNSVSLSVTAAAGTSVPEYLSSAIAERETNLVLDPVNTWNFTTDLHLHNVAGVALSNGTVENIDGGGHCVYYTGKAYIAKGAQGSSTPAESTAIYELSGGGYLAPEGTADLGCD